MAKTILTVVGARPQFVKAAAVSRAVAGANKRAVAEGRGEVLREMIVHTGQHYDFAMSQSFFEELEIPEPSVNLEVGSAGGGGGGRGGGHGWQTGTMMMRLEEVMVKEKPDWVLVYGDTNSTLAGALAAVKLHVPVAHVEAGLRSFNRRMPEEINRVVTDAVSTALFVPSEHAAGLLKREGIEKNVFVEGDVMYDVLRHYRGRAVLPEDAGFVLATIHRAENTDDVARLRGIVGALSEFEGRVILPLHPRTRKVLDAGGGGVKVGGNVTLVEPLSYFSLLGHLEKCAFVVTDSGGLQKEAYFMGKRCITVRDETEWVELVEIGANKVVGTERGGIVAAFGWARETLGAGLREVYGRGDAAERIVGRLIEGMI